MFFPKLITGFVEIIVFSFVELVLTSNFVLEMYLITFTVTVILLFKQFVDVFYMYNLVYFILCKEHK